MSVPSTRFTIRKTCRSHHVNVLQQSTVCDRLEGPDGHSKRYLEWAVSHFNGLVDALHDLVEACGKQPSDPRVHTETPLTGVHPPFLLTMNSNLAGTSESRLTLIRFRPAPFSPGRSLARFTPLVVTARVFKPSNWLSSAVKGTETHKH